MARQRQTDSSRGEFVDPRKGEVLLADYIVDHWWSGRSDEPSTADPMRSRIWNHIMPLMGDYALREIDASALRAFKAALLARVEESTAEVIWDTCPRSSAAPLATSACSPHVRPAARPRRGHGKSSTRYARRFTSATG